MNTPIKISAGLRDALFGASIHELSALGDLRMMIEAERWAEAKHLNRELSDVMRFVHDDLGWGEGSGEAVELTSPPDLLGRLMSRFCHRALSQEAYEIPERIEARREMEQTKEQNKEIVAGCCRVLAELDTSG